MPETTFASVDDLVAAVGARLGPSRWVLVDQTRIDAFAEATEDRQWLHVDPERAADGPFGGTIAHGYLTLALVAPIIRDLVRVRNLAGAVNYGMDRVRFPAPVPSGSRVRGSLTVEGAEPVPGGVQARFALVVEIENTAKPACVADVLVRLYPRA